MNAPTVEASGRLSRLLQSSMTIIQNRWDQDVLAALGLGGSMTLPDMNTTLFDYEQFVDDHAKSPLPVMALGLAGETGEAVEHVKKLLRGDGPKLVDNRAFALELGDVLFYLTYLAHQAGKTLPELMNMNMEKLILRHKGTDTLTRRFASG